MTGVEVLVFECGLDRKAGTVLFYLGAVASLVVACLSHVEHHGHWHDMYGFIVMGGCLLLLCLWRIYHSFYSPMIYMLLV